MAEAGERKGTGPPANEQRKGTGPPANEQRKGTGPPANESQELDPTQAAIGAQLGRPLRAVSKPLVVCHLGLPVVIEVPPVLDDGTPFPTRYWLSCPLAVRRVARIESRGDIALIEARSRSDQDFDRRLSSAHERYRIERDRLIPQGAVHRPSGGVAGAVSGVKCLHAHYADYAAGAAAAQPRDNPVGEMVAVEVEPLDCTVPCVIEDRRNPAWVEPRTQSASRGGV